MKIEEKLKSEAESYEIKTTSETILSKYEIRQQERTEAKTKKRLWWVPLLGLVGAGMVASAIILPVTLGRVAINLKDSSESQTSAKDVILVRQTKALGDQSLLSQAGLQLFYGAQLEKGGSNGGKKTLRANDSSVSPENPQHEEVKRNYNSMFTTINSFFATDNGLSLTYASTSYLYEGITYSYVIIEGDNRLYTVKDIREGSPINLALYEIGGEVFSGIVYVDSEEEEQEIRCWFRNGNKEITMSQESDEDGAGLFYRIVDTTSASATSVEFYKISLEWAEEETDSSFDECFFLHSSGTKMVKAETQYKKKKNEYSVDYLDIAFHPYSFYETTFTFTLNEDGSLNYRFSD